MRARRNPFSRLLSFVASLRVATLLLALLIIACIAGGLIPQSPTTPNADEIYRSYGLFAYRLITRLQLDDVFGSPWFIVLVGLFALNLLLCTGRRLRGTLRRVFGPVRPVGDSHESLATLSLPVEPAEHDLASQLGEMARRVGFRRIDHLTTPDERAWIIGRRRRWGALGADVVHVGILIILVGAVLGFLREDHIVRIHDWQTGSRLPTCGEEASEDCLPLPYDVQVEGFGVEIDDETGRVKDYWADVTLWEGESTVQEARISVNRPMTVGGTGLYVWRYGEDPNHAVVRLQIVDPARNLATAEIELRIGETAFLPEWQTRVTAIRYLPPLSSVDQPPSTEFANPGAGTPAVVLELETADEHGVASIERTVAWTLLPQLEEDQTVAFVLSGVRLPRFVDLHVTRNPGYPFFWWGFLLVMGGLAGAFYLRPCTLHVAVGDGQIRISAKGPDGAGRGRRLAQEIARAHGMTLQEEDTE